MYATQLRLHYRLTESKTSTAPKKPLDEQAWIILNKSAPELDWSPLLHRTSLAIESLFRKRDAWHAHQLRGDCLVATGYTSGSKVVRSCLRRTLRQAYAGMEFSEKKIAAIAKAFVERGEQATDEEWAHVLTSIDFDKPFDLRKRVEQLRIKQ